jgi:PPE-repeat protein
MTQAQGETAVTTSALICGGMYVYRKLTEHLTKTPPVKPKVTAGAAAKGVLGVGEILPAGTWLTGAGVTFIGLSIITSVNANLGGSLAILTATGAILGNGQAVLKDVSQGLAKPQAKQAAQTGQAAPAAAGPQPGNHPPTTVK